MRLVNVRDLKIETSKVLGSILSRGPVVITRRGKPIALMRSLSAGELDIRFAPLWDRIRLAAERAGYRAKDATRLVSSVRSKSA